MLNVMNAEGVQLQAKLFRGFGDPARLNILQALRNGPMIGCRAIWQLPLAPFVKRLFRYAGARTWSSSRWAAWHPWNLGQPRRIVSSRHG